MGARVPRRAHLEGPEGVSSGVSGRRMAGAALAALAGLVAGLAWPVAEVRPDHRPNVIVVLTDDERWDGFDAMPWLTGGADARGSGWETFPNAFSNTPLCCPARASLLTGRYARHTGVEDNDDGGNLDESSTLATWLHGAGYRTGLVGKYLNSYPFGVLPYVPPGWDRFVGKRNHSGVTVYRDFRAVRSGVAGVRARVRDGLARGEGGGVRADGAVHPAVLPPASLRALRILPGCRLAGTRASTPTGRSWSLPTWWAALRGAPPWVRSRPEPSCRAARRMAGRSAASGRDVARRRRGAARDRRGARGSPRRHVHLRALRQRLLLRRAPMGEARSVPTRRVSGSARDPRSLDGAVQRSGSSPSSISRRRSRRWRMLPRPRRRSTAPDSPTCSSRMSVCSSNDRRKPSTSNGWATRRSPGGPPSEPPGSS